MLRIPHSPIARLIAVLPAFLLAPVAVAAPAQAQAATSGASEAAEDQPTWAFEESDLPVDPAFRFGQLENGMRYIIRQNATPPGQGEVRLYVDAGSLSEQDDELGYAHFIEHMAFNGSKKVPEGEMVKLLEREGLAFGADTNASTSFDSTIYKLNLPRNDIELLDTAMMLMRETASELTFAPEAVEREKGVILSEKRVRDTYAMRNLLDSLAFSYPSALLADRLPIGTTGTLNAASSEKLKALYERLYTPGNSTVIVIGDFDPDLVEQKIREYFTDWASAPTPPSPDAGPIDPQHSGETSIYVDPALSERITLSRNGPWLGEQDNAENRRINLLRRIGYGIVNRRFQRMANGEAPPFRGAGLGTSDVFEAGRTTNLMIDAGDGEWQNGLSAAVTEYRRAMAYGFSQAEVDEQLAIIRTGLENNVAGAETRSNSALTAAAIGLVEEDQIPTTPQSGLERFESYADEITPQTVMDALLQEALPLEDPLLRFEGRTAPEGGEEALRTALEAAMATPVERGELLSGIDFAYTDFGAPGLIVQDEVDPELGIRELRFENGLRLNLKHTELEQDRVRFELNIDGGEMLDTAENPLATAMVSLLPRGGLGKHSYDELQTMLAGRSVSYSIRSRGDTFEMSGTTTPRDLELQLDLLAAAISDPGYRPQGEEQYRRSVANFFARKDATPNAAVSSALGGIVSDGDPRFTLQPMDDYQTLSFDQLQHDIGNRLSYGALELTLVGDFDEEKAIAMVAESLGALPAREPDFRPYSEARKRSFTQDRSERLIRHSGNQDQALLQMIWPTRDDADPVETMKLELLERVIRIELTDSLREELGQTYSPGASASQSRDYEDYGTFTVSAALDTGDVDAARTAIIETIEGLRSKLVDEDTLLRARRPMEEQLENMLKTNKGWMSLVDRAQSEADRIDRYLNARSTLDSLTSQDLQAEAQRYLDPEERLEVLALPEPPSPEMEPAGDE